MIKQLKEKVIIFTFSFCFILTLSFWRGAETQHICIMITLNLPSCMFFYFVSGCLCEFSLSSNVCCLRACVCLVCLCSSKTLPDPPVFVFAPRAPLHFAFTEGKPSVKMLLTPIPTTRHITQRANTGFHFHALSSFTCQNVPQSWKPANILQYEEMTYIVSRNSLLSDRRLVTDFVFTWADFPKVSLRYHSTEKDLNTSHEYLYN